MFIKHVPADGFIYYICRRSLDCAVEAVKAYRQIDVAFNRVSDEELELEAMQWQSGLLLRQGANQWPS
jgi:hypothetical protein